MADKSEEKKEAEEPREDIDYWVEHATASFSERPNIVYAALSTQDRKTFTEAEAKEAINAAKKVKVEPGDGTVEAEE